MDRDAEHLQSYLEYVHGIPCRVSRPETACEDWVEFFNVIDEDKPHPMPFFDNQTGVVI